MAEQTAPNKSSITQFNPSNKPKFLIGIIIVILLLLGGVGFVMQSNTVQDMVDSTSQGTNSSGNNQNGDGSVTVETENGKIEITEGKVPDNFPDDIAIYKGASVEKATNAENESSVELKTDDKVSKVADFYKKSLKENGWKEIESIDDKGSVLLQNEKDDRTAIILITTDKTDNKTSITIAVGKIKS